MAIPVNPIRSTQNSNTNNSVPGNSRQTDVNGNGVVGNLLNNAVSAFVGNAASRLGVAGLFPGGANTSPDAGTGVTRARFAGATDDRARLSLSPGSPAILYRDPSNRLLAPLLQTNGVVWPYTPTINSSFGAIYTPVNPTHSNFNQQSYNNSVTNDITVIGQFTANTPFEAAYVLAVINFFRASNKMFFGQDELKGTPPPVLRFSAHGPNMFNSVPVVVSQFSQDFESTVDYMEAYVGNPGGGSSVVSRVPTLMTVNVTLSPVITRRQQVDFSLERYARGDLIGKKNGVGGVL